MVAASSLALDLAPAVTTELSACRACMLPERAASLLSWRPSCGKSVLAVLCPPSLFLSWGERWILGCVPGALCSWACAVGIMLQDVQPPQRSLCLCRP